MAPKLEELVAPGRCALLLQEVQEGVVGPSSALPELAAAAEQVGLVDHLRALTAAARQAGIPVIHCTAAQMPEGFGSNRNARLFGGARRGGALDPDRIQPCPGLMHDGDFLLPRFHGLSPLTGSQLDSLLRNEGIETVVVTGVSLNVAIPNLVFDAVNRSYQTVVVTDAVAGVPVEYGEQVLRHALSLLATLTTSAQLAEVWTRSN